MDTENTNETQKPKKKKGRPKMTLKERGLVMSSTVPMTKETYSLLFQCRRIKDMSNRQVFERALRAYVEADPELNHLLKK